MIFFPKATLAISIYGRFKPTLKKITLVVPQFTNPFRVILLSYLPLDSCPGMRAKVMPRIL